MSVSQFGNQSKANIVKILKKVQEQIRFVQTPPPSPGTGDRVEVIDFLSKRVVRIM